MNNSSKWFSCVKKQDRQDAKLFCFPHAGAGATTFAQWGNFMPQNVSMYPVLYPMREQRRNEPIPASIRELAYQIAKENEEEFNDKPFGFYGHCEGGIIAYETAIAVKKLYGKAPEILAVSGANPPSQKTKELVNEKTEMIEAAKIFAEMKFLPSEFSHNEMYLKCFVPVLVKDFILLQNYQDISFEKILCPILVMYGSDDINIIADKLVEWEKYTKKDIAYAQFEGEHFFINKNNLTEILQRICKYIV